MFTRARWLRISLTMLGALIMSSAAVLRVADAARPPAAPVKYTWWSLPTPQVGTAPVAYGINDLCDVVGSVTVSGQSQAVLWESNGDGTWNVLNLHSELVAAVGLAYPEYSNVVATDARDINNSGQIAGSWVWRDDQAVDRSYAFLYDRNVAQLRMLVPDSDTPPWWTRSASCGMNNNGDVVGHILDDGLTAQPFVWYYDSGQVEVPSIPDGSINLYRAIDTSDSGYVICGGKAANISDAPANQRAVVFAPSGTYTVIMPIGNYLGSYWTYGRGVNNLGVVVGQTTTKRQTTAYSFTTAGGMVNLGSLGNGGSDANGINDVGQIVGWYVSNQDVKSFLYIPGKGMLDLWTLIVSPPPGMVATNVAVTKIANPDVGRQYGCILANGGILMPDK